MFKKLFGALTGDNKQENQNYEAQTSNDNYENDYEDEYQEVEYDPETLHGTHYTVEDFDAEVAERAEAWIADGWRSRPPQLELSVLSVANRVLE